MRAALATALAVAFALGGAGAAQRPGRPCNGARLPRARPIRPPRRASPPSRRSATANDFDVDATARRRAAHARRTSRTTAPSCSSTRPATCSAAAQETAVQPYVHGGGGFLGIGSAAQGEAGSTALRPAARRPPGDRQPDRRDRADRRGRRPRPPVDAGPAARRSNRSDSWYQWQTRPTGTVHTVARYHAPERARRRRHRRRRHGPPDLVVPRHPEAAAPSTPAWAAPPASYGEASFTKHLGGALQLGGRPRARRLQGHDQLQLPGPAHRQRRRRSTTGLTVQRRVARPRRPRRTAGCSTSAAATAAPTQERGALLDLPSLGRILDHSNPNVGIGCGCDPRLGSRGRPTARRTAA